MTSNKKTILSVDDDPTNLFIIEECLNDQYTVISADSGKKAVELLKDNPTSLPDIILLDVMMPQMDGFQTLAKIREIDKEIPVIFITALGRQEDICKGLEAGAQDYIIKPFHLQELKSRVDTHIKASNYLKLTKETIKIETVKAMITSIAHEINNPLTVVMSNVEFITPTGEEDQKILETINNNLTRIANIIKKIEHLEHVEFSNYIGTKKMLQL
ncbi:MAG: response regulator [Oligoflexia bacterium]|nr:response regulator [Oligoflexia bacterium]